MFLNPTFFKQNKITVLLVLSALALYWTFAYDLTRTDYTKLIALYSALFVFFYKLVQLLKHNIAFLTGIAFCFRAIFILALPNLSQDFYRFIWDGRMILEGYNPYLFTVESFLNIGEFPVDQAETLYTGMGNLNASHFTNYPPINQLCFVVAGLFSGKSILGSAIVMRLLIIAADFGTLHFGKKLLKKLELPVYNIFWYILNPFIIIELTGNLHFEGVMIFFLIWSLYLLYNGKWQWAAVTLALSVSTKLIPLIFLPIFFKWFTGKNPNTIVNKITSLASKVKTASSLPPRNNKKENSVLVGMTRLILFYSIVGITTLVLFSPFYSANFINNYAKTVGLWFQNFEFNASLYYIARAIGYSFRGYNEIAIIGKITPLLVILFVLVFTFFRKNKTPIELITTMLLVLSFYYFTSAIVHPWYIATLLILSIFTKYKFPLVWSFVIISSYLAYANTSHTENLWIIALEYIIVYAFCIWELFFKKVTQRN